MSKLLIGLLATFLFNTAQAATSVSYIFGADDYSSFSISTNDNQVGDVVSSSPFGGLGSGTSDLTLGFTNYLHFAVSNFGGPLGLSGQFTLTGDDFVFSNGTKFLTTLTQTVNGNLTGFGDTYVSTVSFGPLSQYPWIAPYFDTPEITDTVGFNDGAVAYISIPVYAVSAVPEPESYAMLIAGMGIMGFVARTKKKKA